MASGTKDKSTGRDEASFSSQLCKPEVSEPLVCFTWRIGDQSLPWASPVVAQLGTTEEHQHGRRWF